MNGAGQAGEWSDRRRMLGELVHAYAWRDLEETFIRLYPGDPDWVLQHARVFDHLKTIRPRLSDLEIVIDTVEDADGDLWIDVSGRSDDELVAIEFVDWAEWLGMVIDDSTMHRFTTEEVAVHCVWEMSFFGFDEDTIQEKWGEIEVLASRHVGARRK